MFQLSDNEVEYLRSQIVTANISSKSRSNPYVFIAALLKNETLILPQ